MNNQTYTFTREQLRKLMNGCFGMFAEYRDAHGRDEDQAQTFAVLEVLEGLDADKELSENGYKVTLQTIPA